MPESKSSHRQSIINFPARPEFSFSNFVVYEGSEIAFASAKEICSSEKISYNTLYISGESGLGKTHLLVSIGNSVAENLPGKKALYLRCDDFVRNIALEESSFANKTLGQLADVNYLLMDNIDQISGQGLAQEKLYHIYNTIAERGGKIVFSGRKSPDQLFNTESYLKSRFNWGMTATIRRMDDAASARVIKKLCRDIDLDVSDKIITFLLNRIPRDYPSLKKALTKINQKSFARKSKVTLPLVKETLDL